MKRKLFALLLSVVMICSLSVTASAAVSADTRNSVVVISTCMDTQYGEFSFGTGTGFFINDQYLVTNHHVIDTFEEYGSGELVSVTVNDLPTQGRAKIRVYYDDNDFEEAYIVGNNAIKDIAILKLDKPTTKRTPLTLKVPTEDMVGSAVYVIGFPGLADNLHADSTQSWGVNDSTVTSGTISRLLTTSGTGQQNVQIDCDIRHGNSGGPVVDESGAAIGVATWSVSNNSQESVNYAVNIQEAISIMNQYGVQYTLYSDAPAGGETTGQEEIQDPAKKETNVALIVAVAVAALAVIAVVVLVIVLVSRRKKPQPQPVVIREAPAKVPVIRSHARENYGTSVRLMGQSVMIGRSNDCALRFSAKAPGVSGSHCTVQWDAAGRSFVVTDLKSSYGTFMGNGQKLQPNVPYRLQPGEKIWLGDQNNVISLELE